jgi:hypothetical protein
MRIRLEQVGGVAGPAANRRVEIDTATLPPAESQRAADLARGVGSTGQSTLPSAGRRHPDALNYRITIEDGDTPRVLVFSDADTPDGVAPLLAWLQSRER